MGYEHPTRSTLMPCDCCAASATCSPRTGAAPEISKIRLVGTTTNQVSPTCPASMTRRRLRRRILSRIHAEANLRWTQTNTDSQRWVPVWLRFASGHCRVKAFSPCRSALLSIAYLCPSVSIGGCIKSSRLGTTCCPHHAGSWQGQPERKNCAATRRVVRRDPALVILDDPLADREPQPGAVLFAVRDEGLE